MTDPPPAPPRADGYLLRGVRRDAALRLGTPPRPASRRPRRRARPGRRLDHGRRRRRHRLPRGARPAPPRCWSWSRCAAAPTGSTWSSRTPTRTTTAPGPASASPRTGCSSRTACSACTRPWPPCVPLWTAGQVAAVHAAGLPVANRSHFAAMEEVEDADPGSRARVGWLNRLIGTTPGDASRCRASAPAPSTDPDLAVRARSRRCRPTGSRTSTCPAPTTRAGARQSLRDHVVRQPNRRSGRSMRDHVRRRSTRSAPAEAAENNSELPTRAPTSAGRWPRPRGSSAATSASR